MISEYKIYKSRRAKIFDKIGESFLLLSSGSEKFRGHDTDYPFRPNSNFYYLTGFVEPEAYLLLDGRTKKSIFFVKKRVPELELWTGRIIGEEDAINVYGADLARENISLQEYLIENAVGIKNFYLEMFIDKEMLNLCVKIGASLKKLSRKEGVAPASFHDAQLIIERMRLVKDSYEIAKMKDAAKISCNAHIEGMKRSKGLKTERQMQATLEYSSRMQGSPIDAYRSIVASGDNANTLHYVENSNNLADGELVLIDYGAELDFYASDITRTFPVNGKFSDAQKEVYSAVLRSLKEVTLAVKVGITLDDLHALSLEILAEEIVKMGVLSGNTKDLINSKKVQKYFPHGTGHWLGLDVHDQNPYLDEQFNKVKLEEGMIFTIEPGLYFPASDESIPDRFRGIGIRIEDDILVTSEGADVITSFVPKEIEEIEELMK